MKVILATDGSRHAVYAERLMLTLFAGTEGSLKLVLTTVCPTADLHSIGMDFPAVVHQVVDQNRRESSNILSQAYERLEPHFPAIETRLLDGHPSQEIVQLIDETQPDVCVVGSHGWSFSERFFLGSVSDQIAKHTRSSVLVAKPRNHAFEAPKCERILIADDGSDAALDTIRRLESLPVARDLHIRLVTVVQDAITFDAIIPEQFSAVIEQQQQAATERLERNVKELKLITPHADFEVRTGSNISKELLHAVQDFEADLIMVGGRKKGLLERVFLGSVSLSVLHHAPCSVWIER